MKKPFFIQAGQAGSPAFSPSGESRSPGYLLAKQTDMPVQPASSNNELKVQRIALSTGVTLDYAEKGPASGTPVIFLHGITDSWHSFESVLLHLPSSIRGFALTQRGHGDSERPAEGYTPAHFAADVAAFIEQKGLGKAIVVGHSMGGLNALQFAIDFPQLAKAIVII